MTTQDNKPVSSAEKPSKSACIPGFTVLSVSTILLGLFFIGFMIQVGNVHAGASYMIGGLFALPLRPVMFLVPLILISALVLHLTKKQLYTRAELVCILGALVVCPPLLTEGFWTNALGCMLTIPQTSDMAKLDGYSHKMWPHGENLVEDVLSEESAANNLLRHGKVQWETRRVHADGEQAVPVLSNVSEDDRSWVRVPITLFRNGVLQLYPDEPYLLTVLARAEGLESESSYYCRIILDDSDKVSTEVFSSRETARPGYLHPEGFILKGRYGVEFGSALEETAYIELGLIGRGEVAFSDLEVNNVSAVTEIFEGRRFVTEEEYALLPGKLRGRVVVRPDSMLSMAGIKLLLSGGIPLREWVNPTIFWLGYIFLLLTGTFVIAVIMRRQWIENERYPIPVAQIPIRLLGLEAGTPGTGGLPPIWTNRMMWTGFGITFFWCIMKIWAAYNSSVPNLSINVPLSPYFSDPSWGGMWGNINFKVCSIFLALALFMELNVLMTIVLGFFLFRAQYWFGYTYGLNSVGGYPFGGQQMNGSYLMYALLILFFTRKYLWGVLRQALSGRQDKEAQNEVMSYRACLVALALGYVGVALWARWAGLGVAGMLVFYTVMLLVSFVAAKLRAECGVPFTTYFPWALLLVVPFLGGARLFVPAGFLFIAVASDLFVLRSFLLIPGSQVEMIELGRRARVVPRHVFYVFVMGLVGAWLVGGWYLLSNSYASGLGTASSVNRTHIFQDYGSYIQDADQNAVGGAVEESGSPSSGMDPATWAMLYGAVTVTAATLLRQAFAGFWFHPIGFLVGATWMAQEAWGSLLLGWLIRLVVLKLGGAATVREKLLPFAVGIFLGGTASYLVYTVIVSYLKFFVPGTQSVWWSIWAL